MKRYRLKNARYHKVMSELFEVREWHESFDDALSYAANDYFNWVEACQCGEYDEQPEEEFKVCDGCEDHYFSPEEVEVVPEDVK